MRADRLLSILLLLQANGRMTAQTLAKRLEVSERTILRDMDALSGAGVRSRPSAESVAAGACSTATRRSSPVSRRPRSKRCSSHGRPSSWRTSAFRRRPKARGSSCRRRCRSKCAGKRSSCASAFSSMRAAGAIPPRRSPACRCSSRRCGAGRRVRFDYERSPDGASERIVDPLGLVARGNAWYLVADKGEQRRTYRVSRITAAALLEEPGRRPAQFNLAEHWERAATEFRDKLPSYYATFLADAACMGWVRYRGRRVEQETREGERVRIRMRFDVAEEALQFALALGAAIEVCEPEELRARVLAAAEAIVQRYRDAAASARCSGATASPATSAQAAVRRDP